MSCDIRCSDHNLAINSGAILSDREIKQYPKLVIEPFVENVSGVGILSYGLASYGYDIRVGRKFKICEPSSELRSSGLIDPKKFNLNVLRTEEADQCLIPPNSFALAESVEYLEIPRDVMAMCLGKSTYARCGVIIPMTPLEPEWRGKVTIEICNTTPLPVVIYANEGICQVLFFKAANVCARSYNDKRGKYQDQDGLTLPK